MLRRTIALVLLACMAACSTYRPVTGPHDYLTAKRPSRILVTTEEQDRSLVVRGPRMLGDTIVGFVAGQYMEFPLTNVRSIYARETHKGRTTLLTLSLITAGVLGIVIFAGGAGGAYEDDSEDAIGIISRGFWR